MSGLRLDELTKRYGEITAVDRLTLEIGEGQLLALVGPSGCGKTTVLRMVAGLIEPDGGRVNLGGADITDTPVHKRNLGLVFQSYALFPHMSVNDNVAFGLQRRGVRGATLDAQVSRALAMVRLDGLGLRKPRELSGGQQQRVALARAIAISPQVLLLDEPLSNLDATLREEMRAEIRRLQQELRITALFVTHDQAEALTMADRIAVLNGGRLEQIGSPEDVYRRPANAFVASFVGRANFITETLAVRPEDLSVVAAAPDDAQSRPVRVLVAAFAGAAIHYTVALDEGRELRAHVPPDGRVFRPGEAAHVAWAKEDAVELPSSGARGS